MAAPAGESVVTYLLIKSLHLLFVVGWMAAVFYLPRILVNLAESPGEPAVHARLLLMGRRLYKFGHNMFGLAFLFGVALWQGWRVFPARLPNVTTGMHWIDAKLTLVAVLLAYFIWTGRLLKRHANGGALPSGRALRWLNELPVLVLFGVLYLVIAKPF
ncbi:CopD family protein [Rhodanobacter ginsengisoli]|uniref:Protoporphyrinogen IX oxidase n=1 Tax=Rhodanobacter ginsengisoli TaxID=418646 RepID=A0ABW0QJZ8_9GAMM